MGWIDLVWAWLWSQRLIHPPTPHISSITTQATSTACRPRTTTRSRRSAASSWCPRCVARACLVYMVVCGGGHTLVYQHRPTDRHRVTIHVHTHFHQTNPTGGEPQVGDAAGEAARERGAQGAFVLRVFCVLVSPRERSDSSRRRRSHTNRLKHKHNKLYVLRTWSRWASSTRRRTRRTSSRPPTSSSSPASSTSPRSVGVWVWGCGCLGVGVWCVVTCMRVQSQ